MIQEKKRCTAFAVRQPRFKGILFTARAYYNTNMNADIQTFGQSVRFSKTRCLRVTKPDFKLAS